MIAGAADPEVREERGDTLLILMAVTELMQSISRQMVTSFYQVTVCGESGAAQLVTMSPFACTLEVA